MEKRGKIRYIFSFVTLTVLLGALIFWNINAGSVSVSLGEVFSILFQKGGDETARNIIWSIRLPRILAALILGGALSVSGFLLQTFFNNPIAGPFVLGISSGAKLTVALTMIFLLGKGLTAGSAVMIMAAFVGSLISMGFVLLVSRKVRNMSMLVICGVMIGYICSAVTDFVVTFADDSNIINLHNWSQGSFSGMNWDNVALMAVVVFVALGLAFFLSKPMSAYQLGGGLREKYGREYQSVPGGTDPAFQRAFRLRDGFCRSDLLCGNCSAAADEESSENGETDSGDSGLFPGRSSVLPLL